MRSVHPLHLLITTLLLLNMPGPTVAQGRRFLTTPGIVVETGARHAACDALMFTKDGKSLLAAGDDKVVRTWAVGPTAFASHQSKVFRWPIFRKQLGCIFALAPSKDERKIAIGGYGMKPGMVAVLDRTSGEILHILENPPSAQVTWAIAFSPKGDTVVFGTEIGDLFAWTPSKGEKAIVLVTRGDPDKVNRARLIQFLDDDTILCVTQDGKIREWNDYAIVPYAQPRQKDTASKGTFIHVKP